MYRSFSVTLWALQSSTALVHQPLLQLNNLVKGKLGEFELVFFDIAQHLHDVLRTRAAGR